MFSSPRCTILSILTSLFLTHIYIFLTQYRCKRSYTRAYTHPYERTHAQHYHLEIYEVTIGTSSLTGMSVDSWHAIDASGSRLHRCLNAKEGEGSGSRDVERSMMHPQLHADGINWRSRIEPARCECNRVWTHI